MPNLAARFNGVRNLGGGKRVGRQEVGNSIRKAKAAERAHCMLDPGLCEGVDFVDGVDGVDRGMRGRRG